MIAAPGSLGYLHASSRETLQFMLPELAAAGVHRVLLALTDCSRLRHVAFRLSHSEAA